jgi:putative membrane protein
MMFYGHGMGMGWGLMGFVVVLPILLIAAGLLLVQLRRTPGTPAGPDPVPDAERVLADRFAHGEIDSEEYEQRLRTLRAARR